MLVGGKTSVTKRGNINLIIIFDYVNKYRRMIRGIAWHLKEPGPGPGQAAKYIIQWKRVLFKGEKIYDNNRDSALINTVISDEPVLNYDNSADLHPVIIAARIRAETSGNQSAWSDTYWRTIIPVSPTIHASPGPYSGEITVIWNQPRLTDVSYKLTATSSDDIPLGDITLDCTARKYVWKDMPINTEVRLQLAVTYREYLSEPSTTTVIPRTAPEPVKNAYLQKCGSGNSEYYLRWDAGGNRTKLQVNDETEVISNTDMYILTLYDGIDYVIKLTATTGIDSAPLELKYKGGSPCTLRDVCVDGAYIKWGYTDADSILIEIKDRVRIIPSAKSTRMAVTVRANMYQYRIPTDVTLSNSTVRITPINEHGAGEVYIIC